VTTLVSRSPQRPDDIVVEAREATAQEVGSAVGGARAAQHEWARLPATSRAGILASAAERLAAAAGELTELGIREVGKPRSEMSGEVARGVAILRYYAQQTLDPDGTTLPSADGRSLLLAVRRPHGVAGIITPWNFPVAIPLWKVAPALAYGNAVVWKPAPQALATALLLAKVLAADLPEGLLSVVPGDAVAGGALVDASDAISFTGSLDVGRAVVAAAAARPVAVQAEMGGQNASIVFADADVARAAAAIATAAMGYAGQKCTATSRVVVVGNPDQFTDALVAAVGALAVGDPADAGVAVGPVIDDAARRAVLDATDEVRDAGGRILSGGRAAGREGYYVLPTLVDRVAAGARVLEEEVFGPIAAVVAARDADDAVRIANGVRHGLAAAVFTSDLDTALDVSSRLDAGLVKVNAPTSGVDFYAPFGGTKASSYGAREQGKAARDFYTWSQTVTIAPSRR